MFRSTPTDRPIVQPRLWYDTIGRAGGAPVVTPPQEPASLREDTVQIGGGTVRVAAPQHTTRRRDISLADCVAQTNDAHAGDVLRI